MRRREIRGLLGSIELKEEKSRFSPQKTLGGPEVLASLGMTI
jgi:hypothetical protein